VRLVKFRFRRGACVPAPTSNPISGNGCDFAIPSDLADAMISGVANIKSTVRSNDDARGKAKLRGGCRTAVAGETFYARTREIADDLAFGSEGNETRKMQGANRGTPDGDRKSQGAGCASHSGGRSNELRSPVR